MRLLLLLVSGSFINSLGTGMTAFALGVYAYAQTGSAAAVSLVQLCSFAPIILLAPVAGLVADRYDRRLIMAAGDGGSVLGLAVVWATLSAGGGLGAVCVGVLLSSCLASLTEPALRATVTDIVTAADYVRASGLLQLASAAKFLLAPVAAGLLMDVIGAQGIVLIDAVTCLVTVGCSLAIRLVVGPAVPRPGDTDLRERFTEGWTAVTGQGVVRTLIALMAAVTFAMGAVQTLIKPILLPLGSASAVGVAEAVAAVGLLAGSAIVSARPGSDPVVLLVTGLVGSGAAMTAMCLRPSLAWVAATGALLFTALPACNAGTDALVRSRIPDHVQARAWGIISVLSQAGYLLAFAVVGPLADRVTEPMMADDGALAPSLGVLMSTGAGRGSALLVGALGLVVLVSAALTHRLRGRLREAASAADRVPDPSATLCP